MLKGGCFMKRLFAVLLLVSALLLIPSVVMAEEEGVDISFEGRTYHAVYEKSEVIDGRVYVTVGGLIETMPFKNDEFVMMAWASADFDGTEQRSYGVTNMGNGSYEFKFKGEKEPEAVYLYPYEDDKNPVLLWEQKEAAVSAAESVAEPVVSAPEAVEAEPEPAASVPETATESEEDEPETAASSEQAVPTESLTGTGTEEPEEEEGGLVSKAEDKLGDWLDALKKRIAGN